MAATLTDSGEQTISYWSFPIEKTEKTAEGDLIVYGKATDGTVDSDGQIVDLGWSGKALDEWSQIGNVRVQHQSQRDPAGKALEVVHQPDSHWVKSLIVEPVAKRLVEKGVLTAYSVGIARPVIEPDVTGRARGGIIKGGTLVELSLVDRPANKNCGIQLMKGAGANAEWICKAWGDPGEEEPEEKGAGTMTTPTTATADPADEPAYSQPVRPGTPPTASTDQDEAGSSKMRKSVSVEMPEDVTVGFSPADLAKLHTFAQALGAEMAEFRKSMEAEETFLGKKHRKFSAERRRELAGSGHALADGSYPVPDADALRRAAILARSGHGNVAAARRLIARRAKELGVPNPLSEKDDVKKADQAAEPAAAAAAAAVTEKADGSCACPHCKDTGRVEGAPCPKCVKGKAVAYEMAEMAAKAIAQMNADDNDSDSDADEDDKGTDKSADSPPAAAPVPAVKAASPKKGKGKGKVKGKLPPWLKDSKSSGEGDADEGTEDSNKAEAEAEAEKSAKPTPADGVTGMHAEPVPVHREPDGTAIESLEHDAGMPTVPDSSVHGVGKSGDSQDTEQAAALRFKSIGIAHQLGVLHDMCCPVYEPGAVGKAHPSATFDGIDLMFFAQKAMDSAASGSLEEAARATSLWTHAQTLKMTGISDMLALQAEAHKAFRDANPGVSSFPTPGQISAERFRRSSITAGHAADSPGHEGPHTATIPAAGGIHAEQYTRGFITDGHAADSPANKAAGGGVPARADYVPTIRDNARAAMRAMHDHIAQTFPDVCALEPGEPGGVMSRPVPVPQGTPPVHAAKAEQAEKVQKAVADADLEKAQKKLRKRLGRKVLSGKITVDEARARIGRKVTQKAGGQSSLGVSGAGAGAMGGMKSESADAEAAIVKAATVTAAATATGGIASPDLVKSAVEAAVLPLLERLAASEAQLLRQTQLLDAMAGTPDPDVTGFRGMAVKSASRPGGVKTVAEIAERTQAMMLRELETQWRTSSDPAQREAAWRSLQKMRGLAHD